MAEAMEVVVGAPKGGELTIQDVHHQVQLIQTVLKEVMVEGHHYGRIPGVKGQVLLKSGAEKLAMVFRLAPTFDIRKTELPNGHREYEVVCTLTHVPTGQVLGSGVGSASTMEKKYRYRYEGDGKARRKVENPDIADCYNTALKMAKKRAQVDATLTVTAASDIFEQEMGDDEEKQQAPPEQPQRSPTEDLAHQVGVLAKKLGMTKDGLWKAMGDHGIEPPEGGLTDLGVRELRKLLGVLQALGEEPKA